MMAVSIGMASPGSRRTIALTGARGFTGRHFVRIATERGIHVSPVHSDLTDRPALLAELTEIAPTHVLHLGGISNVNHADARDVYVTNLLGTVNLLDGLAVLPVLPQRVVLASTALVYDSGASLPIDESAALRPGSHYAISKLALEHVARLMSDRLPIIIVRPFNYTGRGQDEKFVAAKIVGHFRRREPSIRLGAIDVEREFNDVRFVCDGYLALLERGHAGQTYNMATGRACTIGTLVQTLVSMTGHCPQVIIDAQFLRPGEVRSLYGSPVRLARDAGPLSDYALPDTLRWMLEASPD